MSQEKYSTDLLKTKYVNDSKITDHYALIPTGQGFENYDKLPDLQKNVYRLIVKRLTPGHLEVLKGKSTESAQNVDKTQENADDEMDSLAILAELKKGKEVDVINYETKEAQTNPPTRYNSGSMILAMENAGKLIEDEELREQIKGAGIGTSATRAEIMKKLERIQYIQINDKTQIITPTQKGEIIYDIVNNSMPDMLNPKLTASWEKGLDMVAKKEIQSDEFMGKLEKYIHSKFNRLVVKY